jgi:hypothetical protein
MTHYRDDLDAARARIETLEAKVKEREAALDAREAELSEMRGEISRLQRGGEPGAGEGPGRGQRAILVALAASGFVMASGYALMMPSSRCHAPPLQVRAPRPLPMSLPMKLQQGGDDEAPSPATGVAFDRDAATKALAQAAEQAKKACNSEGEGRPSYRVKVVFQPNGGVSSATVMGDPLGSRAMSECLSEAFRSVRIPAFDGGPVPLKMTILMD